MIKRKTQILIGLLTITMILSSLFVSAETDCITELDTEDEEHILYFYVEFGPKSYFKITIADDTIIPDGSYQGWCVQTDVIMSLKNHHSGAIYSSYDIEMPEYFKKDGIEKWKTVNYLLNHKEEIKTIIYDTYECTVNRTNLQDVIWYLTSGTPYESISYCAQTIVDHLNSEQIQIEIQDYCPHYGDILVVLVNTYENNDDTTKNVQHIIIELPLIEESDDPIKDDDSNRGGATGNTQPTADGSKKAPYRAVTDEEITFDGSKSYDYDGWIIEWNWSFSDGTTKYGEIINHTFKKAGTYKVYLNVTDNKGSIGTYTTTVQILQANRPPSTPLLTGETECELLSLYNYTIRSTDLDNDTIRFIVDLGDGSEIYTSEYYANNTTITISHTWKKTGTYLFKVYAEDENSAVSEPVEMTITITGTEVEETTGDNIPGFELVLLVVAIGIGFIIFKRRR